jgi:hypothetical protein
MNYKEFSAWFLSGAISILVVVLGYIGGQSLDELRNIRKEMTDLNLKLVTVVGGQEYHARRLDKLEQKVEKLEAGKP